MEIHCHESGETITCAFILHLQLKALAWTLDFMISQTSQQLYVSQREKQPVRAFQQSWFKTWELVAL